MEGEPWEGMGHTHAKVGQTDRRAGTHTSPTGKACLQPGLYEPTGETQSSLALSVF